MVVCSKKATARWAKQPIEIGLPGLMCMIVQPVVLGPDNVPSVTDPAEASLEITEVGLGGTAGQQKWRDLMTRQLTPYMSEFRRQGLEEGLAEGLEKGLEKGRAESRAEDILRILDKRGIAVDDDSRERIASCADLDTLRTWLDRSLTAAQVSDLFA